MTENTGKKQSFSEAPDLHRDFASRTAEQDQMELPRFSSPGSVGDAAREEISNRQAQERQLHRHDDLWKRERARIAASNESYPDFDLGSRGHRNVERDYRERRFVWEQRKDEMNNRFVVQRQEIRANGQTLSAEFTVQQVPGLKLASSDRVDSPAPDRSAAREVTPGQEFRVAALSANREKSR